MTTNDNPSAPSQPDGGLVERLLTNAQYRETLATYNGGIGLMRADNLETAKLLRQAAAALSSAEERGMRKAAKVAAEYRWDDLHNECCEGNMGWLVSKIEQAILAAIEEKP